MTEVEVLETKLSTHIFGLYYELFIYVFMYLFAEAYLFRMWSKRTLCGSIFLPISVRILLL